MSLQFIKEWAWKVGHGYKANKLQFNQLACVKKRKFIHQLRDGAKKLKGLTEKPICHENRKHPK